jgi:hypothetical protein
VTVLRDQTGVLQAEVAALQNRINHITKGKRGILDYIVPERGLFSLSAKSEAESLQQYYKVITQDFLPPNDFAKLEDEIATWSAQIVTNLHSHTASPSILPQQLRSTPKGQELDQIFSMMTEIDPGSRHLKAAAALMLYATGLMIKELQTARRRLAPTFVQALSAQPSHRVATEIESRKRTLSSVPTITFPTLQGFVGLLPIRNPYEEERGFLSDLISELQGAPKQSRPAKTKEQENRELEQEIDRLEQLEAKYKANGDRRRQNAVHDEIERLMVRWKATLGRL